MSTDLQAENPLAVSVASFLTCRRLDGMRYRAVADCCPVPMFITDPEKPTALAYANAAYLEMVGLSLREVSDAGWMRTIHPEDLAQVKIKWARCVEQRTKFFMPIRYMHTSGIITSTAVTSHILPCKGYVGFCMPTAWESIQDTIHENVRLHCSKK